MNEVFINTEYISLSQFLKMADIISSGGAAKFFLIDNDIFVNDELEKRRGRKLYNDDLIRFNDDVFIIKCT